MQKGFEKVSFASPLKAHVRHFFEMTTDHTDGALKEIVDPRWNKSPRQIMIDIGQYYRAYDPLFWVKRAFASLPKLAVISDVRFVNEADHIRNNGGIIVRLERDPALNIYKGVINDISETQLDDYRFDEVLPADRNLELVDLKQFSEYLVEKMWKPQA